MTKNDDKVLYFKGIYLSYQKAKSLIRVIDTIQAKTLL